MKEFHSLAAFGEHMAKVSILEEQMLKHAMKRCAKLVEDEAKAEIGTYQDQAGQFVAWAELKDSTKEDRIRSGYSEDDPLLRTGDLRKSISSQVSEDGKEAQIGSNSDVAVYQELGTKNMPPRSFLGGAMVRKLPEIRKILGESVQATLKGEKVYGGEIPID